MARLTETKPDRFSTLDADPHAVEPPAAIDREVFAAERQAKQESEETGRKVEVYKPFSTMWNKGFRTTEEYRLAQVRHTGRPGYFGTHEGKLVPKDTVVLTTKEGKPYSRVKATEIPQQFFEKKQYKVPTENYEGTQLLLAIGEVKKFLNASPSQQFKIARELNIIPKDSKYVAPSNGESWKYSTSDKAKPIATEDKAYDRAMEKLAKYSEKTDKGILIDGAAYLKDHPKDRETLKAVGFSNQNIVDWRVFNEGGGRPIPELREPVSMAKAIKWALTPWEDEKGKTLTDQLFSPDIPPQAELKARYEAQESAPLWSKILFGQTVHYDKKRNVYMPILLLTVPERKTALARAATQAAKTQVKTQTIPIDYRKFLKTPGAPKQVNWNKVSQALKSGQIQAHDAAQVAAKVRTVPTAPKPVPLTKSPPPTGSFKETAKILAKAHKVEMLSAGTNPIYIPRFGKPKSQWKPIETPAQYEQRIQGVIDQTLKMKPTPSIQRLNKANLVTSSAAYNPRELYDRLSKVSKSLRTQTLNRLSPEIRESLETKSFVSAQTKAQQQVLAYTKLMPSISQALALTTQLQQQNKTQAQIQEAVQTLVKQQTKTITDVNLRNQIREDIYSSVDAINELALQQLTSVTANTKLYLPESPTGKPGKPRIPRIPGVPEGPTGKPGEPRIPEKPGITGTLRFPRLKLSKKADKEKRKQIAESKGAIAWRQGEVGGKDIWHGVVYPYKGDKDAFTLVGKKPPNSTIVEGPGSAYQTIKLLYGDSPKRRVTGDIGFMDFSIEPLGGKRVGIGFKADPEGETKGDITIGRKSLPITERRPMLSKGKGLRITPKRPKLRR